MSLYDAHRIDKPKHFKITPLMSGRPDRVPLVMGFDTEAIDGRPVMLQLSQGGDWQDTDVYELPERDEPLPCLSSLMRWIENNCTSRKTEYLLFGFNLQYEWTQLFGEVDNDDVISANEFDVNVHVIGGHNWQWKVSNYRRFNATILREDRHIRIKVLDGRAFFPGSLADVAKTVGVQDKEKMDKEVLANLTRDRIRDSDFLRYAKQDAVTTRLIGERVMAMHERFDVATCVSAPHLATRVFRRHFLTEEIMLPEHDLEQAGLLSYHGGKNGYYHTGPVEAEAWNLDIVSAYPQAMKALPTVEGGQWTKTDTYREGVHGLWRVRTDNRRCRYGGLFNHDGRRLPRGDAEVWTTSYELDAALAHDETRHYEVTDGYVLQGDSGDGSALTRFVDTFFAEKRVAVGAERATSKLMLNSLYGKFFQKIPVGAVEEDTILIQDNGIQTFHSIKTAPEQPYDYQAGGLYHPPVASLITGFVRARVHMMEHAYRAHATSTDGMFTETSPPDDQLGSDLGQLTAEKGIVRIWRERLYAFGNGPAELSKWAFHGFRGTKEELMQIPLEEGTYHYTSRHMIGLRESTLRDKRFRPGEFALLDFSVTI